MELLEIYPGISFDHHSVCLSAFSARVNKMVRVSIRKFRDFRPILPGYSSVLNYSSNPLFHVDFLQVEYIETDGLQSPLCLES